ncbi:MAG: hypothetical protein R6W99_05575 [Clostridia bacterium]
MKHKKLYLVVSFIIVVALFVAGCSSGKSIISTSVGEMTVKRAVILDEFAGQSAKTGYKMLFIYFEPKDGEPKSGFFGASNNVILTSSDGSSAEKFTGGIESRENFLGFVIPEGATGLMLNWPGNKPIPIKIN